MIHEEALDTLRTVYDETYSKAHIIEDIMIDQFGEANVSVTYQSFEHYIEALENAFENRLENYREILHDIRSFSKGFSTDFIIYFPKVTIRNEFDQHRDIYDLYVTFSVNGAGRLISFFRMCVATYALDAFLANYAHSHLPKVRFTDSSFFREPCLGSGPIRRTQESLMTEYDENLWGLFAFELSKYVGIESIAGGPYQRMDSIGSKSSIMDYTNIVMNTFLPKTTADFLDAFILYYVNTYKLKLGFRYGQFIMGTASEQFVLELSNTFIEWYNNLDSTLKYSIRWLKSKNCITTAFIADGRIYENSISSKVNDIRDLEGKDLGFDFKGQSVKLHILENDTIIDNNISIILSKDTYAYIVNKILNIINYHYGKRQGKNYETPDYTVPKHRVFL